MATLEEMVALNRTAEKIAQMGIRPPGKEAYALAERLLDVIKERQAEIRAKYPQHVGDVLAGNVVHLVHVDSTKPIVEAAKAVVAEIDAGHEPALANLIAATHVHNLINEMPEPLTEETSS